MPANDNTPVVRLPEAAGSGSDLRSNLQIIKRRKWTLILVVLLTVGAAAAFSYYQTPLYTSTALVLVKPLNPDLAFQGLGYTSVVDMPTEQGLATAPDVANRAAVIAGTSEGSGSVDTNVPTGTTFLQISYTAPDPQEAQLWANAYARGYIAYRNEQALIAQQQNGTYKPLKGPPSAAEQIAPASLPTSPSSPKWIQNLVMAFIAGVALGLGLIYLRERFDDRIAGRDDLEDVAGAPVLAILPKVPGWSKKSTTKLVTRDAPRSAPSEAYRTLRTNLDFMARTNELRSIMVVSPNMGEGKTTTTANLAVALARTGKRVIALSCDLRKPRLHRFFDLKNDRGFTTVLQEAVAITDVAQRVDGIPTLRLIASGPTPSNPAEILGSDDAQWLVAELRNYADFVLVDTAPILAVSDALAIAPRIDGVILIADASSTMRGAVRAAREQLELVGANIVGAVFNDFDPAHARMSSNSYRYYGSYEYQEAPPAQEKRAQRKPVDPSDMWS